MRILIVEDEFMIAMTLQQEAIKAGYEIAGSVSTGEKAIEFARSSAPDLILMDIRLAGDIDGIEAAKEIGGFSTVPIIFTTGYANPETTSRAKQQNPLAFLTKPVFFREIQSILESMTG